MAQATYQEGLHPRDNHGRWKDKGAAWLADNPMMTRKGMIGSSAATAASSLFLMVDSIFKFVMAIFTVGTVALLSWSGIRYAKKRRHGKGSRSTTSIDRMLGTVKASSRNWAAPRTTDAKVIIARAQAKEIRATGRMERRGVRQQHRREVRQKIYTRTGAAAAGWAAGLRARSKPVPSNDPFTMTHQEMASAAEEIGLRYEGRKVGLFDVDEKNGIAHIIDQGAPRRVPVAKLDWDDPDG